MQYLSLSNDLIRRLERLGFSTDWSEDFGLQILGLGLHTSTARRTGVVPAKMLMIQAMVEHMESLAEKVRQLEPYRRAELRVRSKRRPHPTIFSEE
jgi:hypothetical protein